MGKKGKFSNALIIEDEVIDQMIAEAGFKIVSPKTGLNKFFTCNDALEYLKNIPKDKFPGFILADLKLPGMSLLSFLTELESLVKQKDVKCEVIVCSAYIEFEEDAIKKILAHPLVKQTVHKPLQVTTLQEIWN